MAGVSDSVKPSGKAIEQEKQRSNSMESSALQRIPDGPGIAFAISKGALRPALA